MMPSRDLAGARIVAVHAHPDDEAIWTGGLLADAAERGADVTVVTCTLGEQGEVIGETYQGLVADAADQLGGLRIAELRESLRHLGVRGEFLGGAGRWRDSGMVGDPANNHPRAFINSGDTAMEQLVHVLKRLRPHVVVTYGPDGGYGHPDHIRAHEITHAAIPRLPEEEQPQRIVWAVTSREDVDRGLAAIATIPEGWRWPGEGDIAAVEHSDFVVPLNEVAYSAKLRAMKAHATQLWIADGEVSHTNPHAARATVTDTTAAPTVFALSNLIAQPLPAREHYQLGYGLPCGTSDTSIMAGLSW